MEQRAVTGTRWARTRLRRGYRSAVAALPPGPQRRWLYLRHQRRLLHLNRPTRFTEKINWRMVHDRRDLMVLACDKLRSKQYAERLGVRAARTLWVGTDVGEFERSWTSQTATHWVLKPNFSSGDIVFGEGRPDAAHLRGIVESWMGEASRSTVGEWGYGQADRVIFAEERLSLPGVPILDYKFFVFAGEVLVCRTVQLGVQPKPLRWYERDWTATDFLDGGSALAPVRDRPENLEGMLTAAESLGNSFDFIRVDLYDIQGEVVFGELTTYPAGGLEPLDPRLEERLGTAWVLPDVSSTR